jgi:hypothetical protein
MNDDIDNCLALISHHEQAHHRAQSDQADTKATETMHANQFRMMNLSCVMLSGIVTVA